MSDPSGNPQPTDPNSRIIPCTGTEPYLQPGQQNGSNQPSPLEPFPQPYQWWVPPPAA